MGLTRSIESVLVIVVCNIMVYQHCANNDYYLLMGFRFRNSLRSLYLEEDVRTTSKHISSSANNYYLNKNLPYDYSSCLRTLSTTSCRNSGVSMQKYAVNPVTRTTKSG